MKASNELQPDARCCREPSIIQGPVLLLPPYLTSATSTIDDLSTLNARDLRRAADAGRVAVPPAVCTLGRDVSSRSVTAASQIRFPSQLKDQVDLLSPSHLATNPLFLSVIAALSPPAVDCGSIWVTVFYSPIY